MQITGLKKAVGDYKRYFEASKHSCFYAFLMFNKDTGALWCDSFCDISRKSSRQYKDPAILNLGSFMESHNVDMDKISMKLVKTFIFEYFPEFAA